eukprot:44255_1
MKLHLTLFVVLIHFCNTNSLKMPSFSWDQLPVFIHMCNASGPWNETTLKYFTRFPIITFDKGQGLNATQQPYASKYTETKIIEACKQIKALKADIICIFYYNSINDWTYYYLHEILAQNPSYWLKDNNNQIVLESGGSNFPQPEQGMLVPDYRQKAVQQLWTSECINITTDNYGIVDGCFIDKPQVNSFNGYNFTQQQLTQFEIGHNNSIISIQKALNKSNSSIVISNNGYIPEGVIASQLQNFKSTEKDILQLLSLSSKQILVEAHAQHGRCHQENITTTIAAFLIGANKYSYFACSDGWFWPDNWNVWYSQYDKPLGEPIDDAIKIDGIYYRSFKRGTNVTFNTYTNQGTIQWA